MPDHDFNAPRIFVEDTLAEGGGFPLSVAHSNYLANVLRLADGDAVLAFNGRDGEWRCTIARASKKSLSLTPAERVRAQEPAPDLHYLFAPLKAARLDYMIQKACEMGAGVLRPVMTQHTQNPRFNLERAQANAVEAAEQCGILAVPRCAPVEKLAAVLEGWDPARRLFFCDERAESADPLPVIAAYRGEPLAVLIGPEGGFSRQESEMLLAYDFVTAISLGPRILRADTAAVAALAVVQAAAGDWATPSS
ncbi:16S rRNA (uracil(1498)-N(3))-methyltransferase [Aureimonas mangrovi]|uniref:16S rRNA (uracil(1498)-N(3))-methyltransferase n=1 Tax=Aureimonas mangrovi TaxID=2758041 RepID=UPI00163DAE3D|nr:16S rRNA (uracil(1498)-N(3))-methyltransferase [Aureimonas mangrovi]